MISPSKRKIILSLTLMAIIIGGPVVFLSNPILGSIEEWCYNNPKEDSARNWLYRIATIYRYTLRTKKAAGAFEKFAKLYEPNNPEGHQPDKRAGDAWLLAAGAYEKCEELGRAWRCYDRFIRWAQEYDPDHPELERARMGRIRLRKYRLECEGEEEFGQY